MDSRSNDPTPAPGVRLRASGATLSACTLARAEHGLVAFIARWEDPDEITHDRADDGAEGEQ
ncbi:hypothetical protein ACFCZ1_26915 [Streptomyces sp. NPDC056224]|uniref:hypothetical protein n=1 Tax=Streptomyces sp. NPDC056224 TaxID=3345750 RepID=UPI0035DAFADA